DGLSLVFLRYDLDTATWEGEPTPLESPTGVSDFSAWVVPSPSGLPPRVGIRYTTVTTTGQQTTLVSRSLDRTGTKWEKADFAPIEGYGEWHPLRTGGRTDYRTAGIAGRAVLSGHIDGDGRDELVLVPKTAAPPVVLRFDGTAWSPMPRPTEPIPIDAFVALGRVTSRDRVEIVHMRPVQN